MTAINSTGMARALGAQAAANQDATREAQDIAAFAALQEHDGNATKAAAALGLARTSFRAAIKRHAALLTQDAATENAAAEARVREAAGTAAVVARQEAEWEQTRQELASKPATFAAPVEPGTQAPVKSATGFPEGVCTPVEFRHLLVTRGLAPKELRPQTVYQWVNRAGKNKGFPVSHYAADGTVFDARQGPKGNATTKPGVNVAEGLAWYAKVYGTPVVETREDGVAHLLREIARVAGGAAATAATGDAGDGIAEVDRLAGMLNWLVKAEDANVHLMLDSLRSAAE